MSTSSDVVRFLDLIRGVREGDAAAMAKLWYRYWPQLVRVAQGRLAPYLRRECDEEDVANSAFRTFMRRAELGEFDNLHDESSLWSLLCVILTRKVTAVVRREQAQKRAFGKTVPLNIDPMDSSVKVDEELVFMETLLELLQVSGEHMEPYVMMRLEGYENEEIAERLKVSTRTVERRLHDASQAWLRHEEPS